jgi:hypothetical protein
MAFPVSGHLPEHCDNGAKIMPLQLQAAGARANPAKAEDFGDKDLLKHIDLARILFGQMIPPRRKAR